MPSRRLATFCICLALALPGLAAGAGETRGRLHVPSPDWREQVIYFVMTDRFDNADRSNDDLGAGEFDPARNSRYSGGDLRGLTRRLDYIQGLGATALWVTPPVANQWLDPRADYTGYHGYWAEHFKKVDRHLGTLADYQTLSRGLHGRGMYLVQDIVLNHTGNFFGYEGGWDRNDPARFYQPNLGTRPVAAPSQPPFSLNDPRRAADRRAGIYHWTPDIADHNDKSQSLNFQNSGLDDLNSESATVRRALRASHGWWIGAAGVDAFRVDTAFHVPLDAVADFMHAKDPRAPGVAEAARRTGRKNFFVFGEGFGMDKPFADTTARKIESYMTDAAGRAVLPGMLNFPLYGALGDVFARGRPTAELGWRIERTMALHARPHLMPTFVDNHDVDRFLAGGTPAALRQSLLAIFTLPGIPVVYYGTEQGFTEQRASMFAAGYGSGGRDHFDTSAPLYRLLAGLSALRRSNKAFTHGEPTVLARNGATPGVLAWRMAVAAGQHVHRDRTVHSAETARAARNVFVAVNSADHEVLLDKMATGLPQGLRLIGRFGLDRTPPDVTVGAGGLLTMAMPARAGWVWEVAPENAGASASRTPTPPATEGSQSASGAMLEMEPPSAAITGDFLAVGKAAGQGPLEVVVDGNLANAQTVTPDAAGRWQARIDTSRMADASVAHEVVAWRRTTGAVSPTQRFRVERAWQLLADVPDPAGDDTGARGTYRYPTDASYATQRAMDLRRVQLFGAGGALRIDLAMAGLADSWNPANGFDHVAFTIFIELPGTLGGATVMPLQNAMLPGGMRWHRRLRVHGWSNALFTPEGASATSEGRAATPAAAIAVDRAANVVSLVLPAASLGGIASLSGVKVYVTTWDYDGGYRALAAQAQGHVIGGGDLATDPLVMDDSVVITLP
jgi:glycosidase